MGCRKACKKCDDCRPCSRCVRYNISCFDADKKPKPKKKGIQIRWFGINFFIVDQRLIDQPYHLPSRRSAPVAVMENNDGFRDLGDPLPRSRFPSASSFQSIPESMLDQSHDHESTFVTDPEPNELYLLSDVCDMLLADPKRPPKTVDTVDRGLIPPSEPLVKQMIHSRPQSRLPPSFIADPYYIDPNGSESVVHYPHPHVMYHYDPNQQYPNQQYWYHQQEQYPHHPNYQ